MSKFLEPQDLLLTQNALLDGDGVFICVSASPSYVYDKAAQKMTDKRSGTKVDVVIPQQKYAHLSVQLPVGYDDILVPDAKLRFDGFSLRFYRDFNSGEYLASAKADKAVIVKS